MSSVRSKFQDGMGFVMKTPKELYIFVDTTTVAYRAVAYFRFCDQSDQIKCSLIMAKSRLSPLREKSVTLPRLELQPALITTRMKTHIIKNSGIQPNSICQWSSSKVVLSYIKNVDTNFGSYIANRVNEIWSNTDIKQWNYIPSSLNVANNGTKHIDVAKLKSDHQWFVGPDFLYDEGFPIDSESAKHEINAENKTILHNIVVSMKVQIM